MAGIKVPKPKRPSRIVALAPFSSKESMKERVGIIRIRSNDIKGAKFNSIPKEVKHLFHSGDADDDVDVDECYSPHQCLNRSETLVQCYLCAILCELHRQDHALNFALALLLELELVLF